MRRLFKAYRHNRMLIDRLKKRLDGGGMITDTVRGSSAEWPYTEHPITLCGRHAQEETETISQIQALETECRQVEEAMRKAPNSSLRLILELKYMDGLSWDGVAETLGEDVSGDAIRKRADEFFESISGNS